MIYTPFPILNHLRAPSIWRTSAELSFPKISSMVRSINWPPLAQRALLEWIDDHKGPQSALIQNYKQAIAELTKSLRTQFGDNASFSKGLVLSQVEQRINYLWKDRLNSFQSSALETFYRDGTLALDWDKLGHRPIARAYTKDEIASFKGKGVPSTTAATDRSRASDDEEPIRADKRRRTDNGSENRSDSERERQEGRRRKSPSNDVRKEPESQVDRSHSDQNPRNIGPPTVGNDVTHIMSTDNMTPTQQEEPSSRTLEPRHRDKRTRRLSAGFIEVRTKVPVQRRNQVDNGDEKGPLFDLSYLDRSRYNALHPPVPTDLMESEMGILEHGIFSTIAVYADALSIPEDQPMILDTRLRYPDECRLLFDLMLGLDSFRGANSRSETFLAFQQSRTSLIDFLRSFVGCALTNWCLSWPSNPTSYFRGLDDGTVDTVLKEAFTPEIEAEVRQRLWEEHMSVHKVPTIENKAHHMASTLLAYIDMLIPNDPPERRPSEHTDVCRLPEDDPTQNSSQPDGPAPPLRESPDRKALRDSLVTIFKNGLKFQIQMFKNLNAEYVVLWPRFLRPYERKLNRARRARGSSADTDADAGEPKKPVVRLGLMPLIQRRTRGYIHHAKWSEFQLVTKGSVLAL
ncbi:hypothetical protein, variant 3 [Cladophialophora immunda]|uniref:Uncharacterized protein n=1 Tax=Cladophialophora immunda TaxID=569365 RepID=A0A0D2CKH2_9EURO|nr:uncharacterized protein PV07_03298 [Cladophialophora immunda]XP_016251910.1 hypothetical protein, variant 1 [Cladophialophora immunda]XP_016251911.1 hypothetical protein, variant 2 [Cladophialophora immunda]XP_016251912.1 hypothetical protein, variant 3 [Cladophialophora immunda]KIW31693.1 hypothetical protein PV07_03298 [Cladophialophora immunda]KIW31694.1 hypothetical protein, variant 1 [Cladophialophora immunda]KIW31695.1 hypothetical protein, variant 2 [Cladophialophora immunda]KIW316